MVRGADFGNHCPKGTLHCAASTVIPFKVIKVARLNMQLKIALKEELLSVSNLFMIYKLFFSQLSFASSVQGMVV